MDSSESGFISKHRTELINLTTCDVILLETLGTKNILSKCDRQVINACDIDLEKSAKLYDIIVTKTGAFQCLMSALEETKQSGAHSIIAQYYNGIHNVLTFKFDEHDPQESEHRRFLEGWYGPRPVFIKRERRETKTAKEQLSKLVKILTLVDSHINIVRYFTSEFNCESGPVNFVFEQCDINLQSVLESSQEPETVQTPIKLNKISVLQQIARGLSYIKSLGILHLNLRPTNILLTNLVSSGVVVKVSNFSHARQLSYQSDKTLSCPVSHKTVEKNREWLPREILLDYQQFKAKKLKNISGFQNTDVFSVGCIFYCLLTCGQHPFGELLERPGYCGECGNNLIDQLLTTNYKGRISPEEIEPHPFFYSKSSVSVKCEHATIL